MAIATIYRPKAGSSLRVFLSPPAGALRWRLLRRQDDSFAGPDDAGAVLVHEGRDTEVLDAMGLVNDAEYHYRPYYWTGSQWLTSASRSAKPAASYEDAGPDVIELLQERLRAGLRDQVLADLLTHQDGAVPVLAVPPAYDNARWPLVTLHLSNEDPAERFIGEGVGQDMLELGGQWGESEGWLARVDVDVIAWSLNSDERIQLRKALRRVILANLEIFDGFGLVQVNWSMSDAEDFETYNSPVYQVIGKFSCMAPAAVVSTAAPVSNVFEVALATQ